MSKYIEEVMLQLRQNFKDEVGEGLYCCDGRDCGCQSITTFERLEDFIQSAPQKQIEMIEEMIDGRKEVYREGDERFNPDAKDGDVKADVDSCCNETIDDILSILNQYK